MLEISKILFNISFIAFSISRLMTGIKLENRSSIRRYASFIVIYIMIKVMNGDYPLIAKGLFFLMAGLTFLAFNYLMISKIKGGKSDDKISE